MSTHLNGIHSSFSTVSTTAWPFEEPRNGHAPRGNGRDKGQRSFGERTSHFTSHKERPMQRGRGGGGYPVSRSRSGDVAFASRRQKSVSDPRWSHSLYIFMGAGHHRSLRIGIVRRPTATGRCKYPPTLPRPQRPSSQDLSSELRFSSSLTHKHTYNLHKEMYIILISIYSNI